MNYNEKKKILFIIGAIFLLMLVIGGTFAYFQIVANNNATTSSISGEGELVGQATLSTNITELKLNMTSEIMHKDNVGKVYYATASGEAVESSEVTDGNGRYTLATATITESDVPLDCTYSYDISATTSKEITDGSDEDFNVVITGATGRKKIYTLKQLINGISLEGSIKNLEYGTDQILKVEAFIENTSGPQNNLSGNEYTITITPKNGEEGFSCDVATNDPLYSGYYRLDNTTDIMNSPLLGNYFFDALVKVSDDTEIYKEDLLGGSIVGKNSDDSGGMLIEEDLLGYEDDYITLVGGLTKGDELIIAAVVHNTPPSDYQVASIFANAEPGVYLAYDDAFIGSLTLLLIKGNMKLTEDYSLSSDTDITNMTKIQHPDALADSGVYLVKVSSDTLSLEQVRNTIVNLESADGSTIRALIPSGLIDSNEDYITISYNGGIGILIAYNSFETEEMSITEPGIYITYCPPQYNKISLTLP